VYIIWENNFINGNSFPIVKLDELVRFLFESKDKVGMYFVFNSFRSIDYHNY